MEESYKYYYGETGISIQAVQNVELEMLIVVDKICRKHGIPYQIFGGTLLGAVRHKGFIPWDDDIDIAMKRGDYDLFLKICEEELDNKYFLQTCFSDPDSIIQFAKIRKNGTKFENAVDNLPTSHTGIWIDIFPLDNVKPESMASKWQRFQIKFLYAMATSSVKNRVLLSPSFLKRSIRRVMALLLVFYPKNKVDLALQRVYRKYDSLDTGYISHLTMGGTRSVFERYMQDSSKFNELQEFEFCNHNFLGPKNYNEVLSKLYGNYMEYPPKDQRIPQHKISVVEIQ